MYPHSVLRMHKVIAVFTVILLQVIIIIMSIVYLQSTVLLCYRMILIWSAETITTFCTKYNNMETKTPPFYYVNSSLGPAWQFTNILSYFKNLLRKQNDNVCYKSRLFVSIWTIVRHSFSIQHFSRHVFLWYKNNLFLFVCSGTKK